MSGSSILNHLKQVVGRMGAAILELGPRILTALVILVIGIAVAHALRYLTKRLVGGLDRVIPSRRLRASLCTVAIGQPASDLLGAVTYWFVVLLALAAAAETVGLRLATAWLSGAAHFVPSIVSALLIAFAGLAGGVFAKDFIGTAAVRAGVENGHALGRLLQTAIVAVSLLIAADQLGVDTTLLTALLVTMLAVGMLGGALAFGLGARTEVSNILASFYVQKSYQIGNRVRVGEVAGVIVQITPRSVVIDSASGRVTVPARVFSEMASTLVVESGP